MTTCTEKSPMDDLSEGPTMSAVTPFTSAMTAGLKPLSPPGAGSKLSRLGIYHPCHCHGCRVSSGPTWKEGQISLSGSLDMPKNLLCSLLMRYCNVKNYVFLHPHEGNAAKMWEALKAGHQDQSVRAKMLLLQNIPTAQPINDQVKPHLNVIKQLADQLQSLTVQQ
ncbi:hypothetical protein CROQUDRAFT_132090 [Cronartium quercuum f. sp. fusiforme G11]|uniref:Uncharacterized protein n=1 Tax=Cronartium quercuum f. sp. fusiforme G11 TaxID=708437 RepID=A0A9P6TDS9_9BASI|nr:hypothetical protein CROQUDRAFT_132090 [Cronartium quercuum f. sp. fusiforme G11]